ncbi:MAG: hypothetical protein Q4A54_12320, partial [Parabacteroides sp.]|nr:hypothetical protein [Parabacteroides sp.]
FCLRHGEHHIWTLDLSKIVETKEWIQSVDQKKNKLLIAYESFLVVIDLTTKACCYSSAKSVILSDVHYAQFGEQNEIYVADTGNNRIVIIEENSIKEVKRLKNENGFITLKKPRMLLISKDTVYIVNSGESNILVCDKSLTKVNKIFGQNRGMGYDRLSIPRWMSKGPNGGVFISDTDNHRVIFRKIEEK